MTEIFAALLGAVVGGGIAWAVTLGTATMERRTAASDTRARAASAALDRLARTAAKRQWSRPQGADQERASWADLVLDLQMELDHLPAVYRQRIHTALDAVQNDAHLVYGPFTDLDETTIVRAALQDARRVLRACEEGRKRPPSPSPEMAEVIAAVADMWVEDERRTQALLDALAVTVVETDVPEDPQLGPPVRSDDDPAP